MAGAAITAYTGAMWVLREVGIRDAMVFARAFAPLLKQDFMILVMSLLFFLIALLSEFGIAEFLKLYYYKKYAKQLDLYETGEKK